MIKFRIRCKDDGSYFLRVGLGTTTLRGRGHIYTSLPSTFNKELHILELELVP